jgi:hypothetical protein
MRMTPTPQLPNQKSGMNLLVLHQMRLLTSKENTCSYQCKGLCEQGDLSTHFYVIPARYLGARQASPSSRAYQNQSGRPKRPPTESTPAGVLNPFLMTAAAQGGALLKHPVFHAAPPLCTERDYHGRPGHDTFMHASSDMEHAGDGAQGKYAVIMHQIQRVQLGEDLAHLVRCGKCEEFNRHGDDC